jgi:hypothetical protein
VRGAQPFGEGTLRPQSQPSFKSKQRARRRWLKPLPSDAFRHGGIYTAINPPSSIGPTAYSINDSGEIVGSYNGTVTVHGFLATQIHAHSVGHIEVTDAAETGTSTNVAAANTEIVVTGIHLGLTSADFHHI